MNGQREAQAAAASYVAGQEPTFDLARLHRTRATGFHGGRFAPLLYVAEGASPDHVLQLAFGCLDFVRERLNEVLVGEPMTAAEAWALELLVDTAMAAYSACGAEA